MTEQDMQDRTIDPIVSVSWLRQNRDAVTVVDARAYLDDRDGRTNYLEGHIPGAVFLDLDSDFSGPPETDEGRHPLPDPEAFAASLSAAGIDPDTTVVAYDDQGGLIAGRLVWMLRSLGQPAALLDGGIQAWGDDLEQVEPQYEITNCWPRAIPEDRLATADQVVDHIAGGGIVADSRGADRYAGENESIDATGGHVPGAISLPFADNLSSDKTFKMSDELVERFRSNSVDGDAIFYCGSGVSACNNLLAVEAAGLGTPRLYVGSWSGWSSDPSRPVATGPHSEGE